MAAVIPTAPPDLRQKKEEPCFHMSDFRPQVVFLTTLPSSDFHHSSCVPSFVSPVEQCVCDHDSRLHVRDSAPTDQEMADTRSVVKAKYGVVIVLPLLTFLVIT